MKSASAVCTFATLLASVYGQTSTYFGTATDRPSSYGNIVPNNFNLLVSENGMKWDAHERSRGNFDFTASLSQIAYAKQHNMKMRGHCLVWHNQMPSFYCSQQGGGTTGCAGSSLNGQQLLQVIETRMQKTFAALNDPTIIAWDVLNEAVSDSGNGLKHDVFYNVIGPDYVPKIFALARKYAPAGVKLFYNDYGCDIPSPKANQCFELVKSLKAQNLVDGMGFQMHLSQNQNLAGQADLFKKFSDIGVTIHVTEMDVGGNNQQQQASVFNTVAKNCKANPMCEAFGENALLFDNNLQKKPQFAACADVIKAGPAPTTKPSSAPTTAPTTAPITQPTTKPTSAPQPSSPTPSPSQTPSPPSSVPTTKPPTSSSVPPTTSSPPSTGGNKSAGCGKSAGITSGTYSINVNGKNRQYILRVPQNYNPNTGYKFIFALHWLSGTMNDAASIEGGFYGLQALVK
ncbi:hypothetical protein Ae201684_016279 [Aphanomyces euteiches]|uniref:endo-1,4-beta-xylanase n=1 Tax=Aphanomyces euteiches TaxID=100861 RepID=A0A6G0WCZ1_9STRA|nr:hypothetical protein Ae201684_016279 [Aphanomyces euteiches]